MRLSINIKLFLILLPTERTETDHVVSVYKKHDRPSLDDEIWRLKKIAKDGRIHKDLSSHQVKTVKDLLQLYVTNPSSLQQVSDTVNRYAFLNLKRP